jgi:hypothetical protein
MRLFSQGIIATAVGGWFIPSLQNRADPNGELNPTNGRDCLIKSELSVMKSVPPRGSGWVFLEASSLKASGPTRYRAVVLTS